MRPQDRYSFNLSVLLSVCPVFWQFTENQILSDDVD